MVSRELHYFRGYQEKLLEAHRKLCSAYDDTESQKAILKGRLKRLGERYDWGHISKEEYLPEYEDINRQLRILTPVDDQAKNLDRLAQFLSNVASAWDAANQKQRNKLASMLFEEIRIEDKKVVAVKPRPELEPFFRLNFECHTKNIGGDPDGDRGMQYLWQRSTV